MRENARGCVYVYMRVHACMFVCDCVWLCIIAYVFL